MEHVESPSLYKIESQETFHWDCKVSAAGSPRLSLLLEIVSTRDRQRLNCLETNVRNIQQSTQKADLTWDSIILPFRCWRFEFLSCSCTAVSLRWSCTSGYNQFRTQSGSLDLPDKVKSNPSDHFCLYRNVCFSFVLFLTKFKVNLNKI